MKILAVALAALLTVCAWAADVPEFHLAIRNHTFEPVELRVPAGVKFKIVVANNDATPEEFESNDFNREKIVMPGATITVFVGPLKAGTYKFFGDFHQDTAQGRLIVE
ncbi:MAG: cupredoxin domain-containing protein [Proteobacteria bacterium]|nr:cupredoxin domain-containing protein [Pseudomonadota bacterium]